MTVCPAKDVPYANILARELIWHEKCLFKLITCIKTYLDTKLFTKFINKPPCAK
jgi:hypothetical protein